MPEIRGRPHSIFVEPSEAGSDAYRSFWRRLVAGEYQAAQFKRLGKDGREVWIEATYNPIFDTDGGVVKVVKYATDVTDAKLRNANFKGQIDAIGKSQAVAEFNLDGTITSANSNFLAMMGYRLDEIVGRPHAIFVDPGERDRPAYREFWSQLANGHYQAACPEIQLAPDGASTHG